MQRTFREGAAPVIVSRKPDGWVWIDLRYSQLPTWRRLHAVLADGRVVMPAENVFRTEAKARKAMLAVGRPVASLEMDGHLYVETAVALTALRGKADEAVAQIEAIEDVCRATVAGEITIVPIVEPAACGAT